MEGQRAGSAALPRRLNHRRFPTNTNTNTNTTVITTGTAIMAPTPRTEQSIASLLAEEGDAIEANRDAPIPEKTSVTRGHGRSKVLQIRLSEEEFAELERAADGRGLPASTVAREALLRQLMPATTAQFDAARLIEEFSQFVYGVAGAAGGARAVTIPGTAIPEEKQA